MNRARIALAVIVLFSAVCVAQREPVEKWTNFQSWAKLRSGMSKTQVIRLLGQSKKITTSQTGSTNIWYYQQIPPEQAKKRCDGCVIFKKNRTGTYRLYRWQDPNWKQIEGDKKEKETVIEAAAQKARLEREAALVQKKLERAERAKKALELKSQQQEEARKNRAKMLAKLEAMEKEQEESVSTQSGSSVSDMIAEGHFVRYGLILLAVAFAIVLIFKSASGRYWWRHEKKRQKKKSNDLSQKYGIR